MDNFLKYIKYFTVDNYDVYIYVHHYFSLVTTNYVWGYRTEIPRFLKEIMLTIFNFFRNLKK